MNSADGFAWWYPRSIFLLVACCYQEGAVESLAEGKVVAVVQETSDQRSQTISIGGYRLNFSFGGGGRGAAVAAQPATAGVTQPPSPPQHSFALVINTSPDEFVVIGQAFSLTAAPDSPGPKIWLRKHRRRSVREGRVDPRPPD